ncbi:MAG: cytochrome C [Rhodoferax sp.]|uniref:cytochrome C n=1 Tax=Rhodoferax sp. TaxID=50421 RepID=UPI0026201E81|nr:cytochrome C [Rhodoferax sp.]MDD5334254.1 cytochrome C [Rhodoferax sp.]
MAILLALSWCGAALAREQVWTPHEENAAWRAECGSCHLAFPPALLSASDWRQIMARLDWHFGADASPESGRQQEISDYLQRNAGPERQSTARSPELPRITHSDRFVNRHRGAIRLWQKGQLKTLSDCAACHKDARQGQTKD